MKCAQARRDMRGGVARWTHGVIKRRHRSIFKQLCRRLGKKGVGSNREGESCSGNQDMVDAKQEVGMLGHRQATPGW